MNRLDGTLDAIENTRFLAIYHDLINSLAKQQTQFSKIELRDILLVYHKFTLANGPKAKRMTKPQLLKLFLEVFKIYDYDIIENIILFISTEVGKDIGVSPSTWIKLFSVFMTNDIEIKMKFAYSVYSVHNANGCITREMVTTAVEKFFTGDDEDEINEMRLDMVEIIFKQLDLDKDGIITFDEYASVVRKKPMLLEFLGKCFPSTPDVTVIAYCANLLDKVLEVVISEPGE